MDYTVRFYNPLQKRITHTSACNFIGTVTEMQKIVDALNFVARSNNNFDTEYLVVPVVPHDVKFNLSI